MTQHPRSILVVDDDPTILELVGLCLTDEGYGVRSASNGVEALQVLENWQADLIVLDLQMPRLDGSGFLAAQRADAQLAEIPVVLVTAAVNIRPELQDAVAAFLPKPFDITRLLEQVEQLVGPSMA